MTSASRPAPAVARAQGLVLSLALGLAGLAGCAGLPVPAERPVAAPPIEDAFQLNGRFAVRYGKEGGSGRIQWEHTPATDDLVVLSPIGQGLARIVRKDGLYTLTASGGQEQRDRDPDALTERALGWRLPIAGLPWWIAGRPQPAIPATIERGADGRVATLRQSGWQIEYQSFHLESGLPERMRVTREALELRLVIEEWQPLPPAGARP